MKKVIIILFLLFTSGCAFVWTDDIVLITLFKDYDLVKGTSTSNKLKAEYKPFVEMETMP